jgi:hypothetical protein
MGYVACLRSIVRFWGGGGAVEASRERDILDRSSGSAGGEGLLAAAQGEGGAEGDGQA